MGEYFVRASLSIMPFYDRLKSGALASANRPRQVLQHVDTIRDGHFPIHGSPRVRTAPAGVGDAAEGAQRVVRALRELEPQIVVYRDATDVGRFLSRDGYIPTQWDGPDGASWSRRHAERAWKIGGTGAHAHHTVYGELQLAPRGAGAKRAGDASGYGDLQLVLDPSVALRSTFSSGDTVSDYVRLSSLEQLGTVVEDHLARAIRELETPRGIARAIHERAARGERLGGAFNRYVEVQVRGARVSDVVEIREGPDFLLDMWNRGGRLEPHEMERVRATLAARERVRALAEARGIRYVSSAT